MMLELPPVFIYYYYLFHAWLGLWQTRGCEAPLFPFAKLQVCSLLCAYNLISEGLNIWLRHGRPTDVPHWPMAFIEWPGLFMVLWGTSCHYPCHSYRMMIMSLRSFFSAVSAWISSTRVDKSR